MEEASLELLLGCGFFRARAADPLPTFDKVLFGLVWAITSASADVELDAELGEEATLGQKLRLGEGVERALRTMRCPAPLQAHQIQGLDFPALFPVVQWLVKRVLAVREEFGDARRGFALAHYSSRGYAPLDAHAHAAPQRLSSRGSLLDASFPVTRRLRRAAGAAPARTRALAVRWALLEYGAGALAAAPRHADAPADESAALDAAQPETSLTRAAAARLVGLRGGELALAGVAAAAPLLAGREVALQRQLEAAQRQLEGEQRREAACVARAEAAAALAAERAAQLEQLHAHNARCVDEAAALDAGALQPERAAALLEGLRELRELKEREAAFKASCREQLAQLQRDAEAAEAEDLGALLGEEEAARLAAVGEAHATYSARLASARAALAQRALAVSLLRRRLDELPGRPELAQYEARFVELAQAVHSKLDETRRFFAAHNAAAEAHRVLQAELQLLNKLRLQYDAVRSASDETRQAFVASLAAASQGVADNLRKQEERCTRERMALADAQEAHAAALQQGRSYFAALKTFQDECATGEELRARLQMRGLEVGGGEP